MRRLGIFAILLVVSVVGLLGLRHQTGQIDRKQLRDILTQLGYEVKDLDTTEGKEKYSVNVSQDNLNIPVAYEISENGNYIWLTVYLGDPPDPASRKCMDLLKSNADIQPCQFYVTKSNKLMMAVPIENHEVTNAVIRQKTSSLIDNVTSTKDVWQKQD